MKDAYYFPHDSNAKDDPKCIILIEELGLEGYGIFWMLLETLRDQPQYRAPISMIPGLARRYNSTPEKVKAVVLRYELFEVDDNEFFFSESLKRRMEYIDDKRKKRSIAGRKGNEVRWGSQSDRNRIASKVKESKGKESKGKDRREKKELSEPAHPKIEKMKSAGYEELFKMEKPLTGEQLEKLTSEFNPQSVRDVFDAMENFKGLTKKYKSTYLTARQWLNRRAEDNGSSNHKPQTKIHDAGTY